MPSLQLPDPPGKERQSPRTIDYDIQVRLGDEPRMLEAVEEVIWRNQTRDTVKDLCLHLYLNAFRNNRSTFMRESGTSRRGRRMGSDGWGWIRLDSLMLEDGTELIADLSPEERLGLFESPDDSNPDDRTVLRLPLPRPVRPGGTLRFTASFSARLPSPPFARTGEKDGFHMVAQWFPKVAVYEEGRGWNCHQFHANSEFFADYGSYDVAITLPADYVEQAAGRAILLGGATGRQVGDGEPSADGSEWTFRFRADDVHDFAWVVDPDFQVLRYHFDGSAADRAERRRMAEAFGVEDEELDLRDVDVTVLLQPEHSGQGPRHKDAVENALTYFGLWYGPYPYDTLTVVDPPHGGGGAGGMEYPTLITCGTSLWPHPNRYSPEGVTVHEFGHQYWYGLVGNNEFEHAWLDEGFNSYSTTKVLEIAYEDRGTPAVSTWSIHGRRFDGHMLASFPGAGAPSDPIGWLTFQRLPWGWRSGGVGGTLRSTRVLRDDPLLAFARDLPMVSAVAGVQIPTMMAQRNRYLARADFDPMTRNAWDYIDRQSYAVNSYPRPAVMLETLSRILGPETWARVLRTYHQEYRYQHPVPEDFFRVASEVSGRDLAPYFDQAVGGSGLLDYGVFLARSDAAQPRAGWFDDAEGGLTPVDDTFLDEDEEEIFVDDDGDGNPDGYDTTVIVRRVGEMTWPVEIEVRYRGEEPRRVQWDGEERWWRRIRRGGPQLEYVRVDPDRVLLLDADLSNNDRVLETDARPAARWSAQLLLWVQSVLHFYGGLI